MTAVLQAPDIAAPVARRRRWGTPALLIGCVGVAALSLRLPAIVGYDPWVWLIWGRELNQGTLTSDGTIAWKPLPVLVTALLVPIGESAPDLWLLVSRAVGLSGLVAVGGLAARLTRDRTSGVIAAAVAVVAFLLTPDNESRWLRHLLQGNIEPVTAALCVWAVRRHLDGRPGQAVLLGALAGLTRPEVWPFLVLYGAWVLWRSPRRWWVLLPLPLVPLLWFGGDRIASGNPLAGAATAQVLVGSAAQRLVVGLDGAVAMVPVAVWVAAAVAATKVTRSASAAARTAAASTWAGSQSMRGVTDGAAARATAPSTTVTASPGTPRRTAEPTESRVRSVEPSESGFRTVRPAESHFRSDTAAAAAHTAAASHPTATPASTHSSAAAGA